MLTPKASNYGSRKMWLQSEGTVNVKNLRSISKSNTRQTVGTFRGKSINKRKKKGKAYFISEDILHSNLHTR